MDGSKDMIRYPDSVVNRALNANMDTKGSRSGWM